MKVEKSGLRRSASAIWRRHSVRSDLQPGSRVVALDRESAAFRDRRSPTGVHLDERGLPDESRGYAVAPNSLEQFAVDDARNPAEVARCCGRAGYEPVGKTGMPRTISARSTPRLHGCRLEEDLGR